MIESLLFLREHSNYKIEKQVFKDFNMIGMIDDDVISVLSVPCNKDEILERQIVFQDLDRDDFYNNLYIFRSNLFEIKRTKNILEALNKNIEYIFVFSKYVQFYINAIKSSYNIISSSALVQQLHDAIKRYTDKFSLLESLHDQYKAILNSFYGFKLDIDHGKSILSLCEDRDFSDAGKNIKSKLSLCLYKLGYGKSKNKNCDIRLSSALADSIEFLYKEKIAKLKELIGEITNLIHHEITDFIKQIDFYIKIHNLSSKVAKYNIPHCFPSASECMGYHAKNAYDITLIFKNCQKITPNDIHISYNDNTFFILGANGGGKTTYLRAVGVNLIFFSCGCPVFCDQASIFPPTKIYTHFPVDEISTNGRFDAEVFRLNEIIKASDAGSWVFLNETFSGTNSYKGALRALDTMKILKEKNVFCLFVTHFYELINKGFPVLSVIVDKSNQNKRTFKVERRDFSESSFSKDILKKYNLDSESLKNMISRRT